MLAEDFCSYEVAKLLKEKGFDEPCYRWYDTKGEVCAKFINPDIPLDYSSREYYLCPTHQMAMAWLRKKGIYIYIQPTKYVGGALYGFQAIVEDGRNDDWKRHIHHEDNYEEAVEAALKYCLENLI